MRAQIFHKYINKRMGARKALETLAPVAQLERAMDFEDLVWCFSKS
jgi:hypothetical protein